jgi:hypothetical protein
MVDDTREETEETQDKGQRKEKQQDFQVFVMEVEPVCQNALFQSKILILE